MKGQVTVVAVMLILGLGSEMDAQSVKPLGSVLIPESSIRRPQPLIVGIDGGEVTAFTNVALFVPATPVEPPVPSAATQTPYFIETPASIACVYGMVPKVGG